MRHKLDTKGLPFKKKVENFWFYYRWHTIIAIVVVVMIGYSIMQSVNQTHYDFNLDIIGSGAISYDSTDKISDDLQKSGIINDNYEDGKINVSTNTVMPPAEGEASDGTQEQVAQLRFAVGESTVIITDKRYLEIFDDSGVFDDITAIADELGVSDEKRYLGKNGEVVGISAADCAIFNKLGINGEGYYITMRVMTQAHKKNEEKVKEYDNTPDAIRYIIGESK